MNENAVQMKVDVIITMDVTDQQKSEMLMELICEQVMYEGRRSYTSGYSDAYLRTESESIQARIGGLMLMGR